MITVCSMPGNAEVVQSHVVHSLSAQDGFVRLASMHTLRTSRHHEQGSSGTRAGRICRAGTGTGGQLARTGHGTADRNRDFWDGYITNLHMISS
jgi:hypothetical protein